MFAAFLCNVSDPPFLQGTYHVTICNFLKFICMVYIMVNELFVSASSLYPDIISGYIFLLVTCNTVVDEKRKKL